MKPIQERLLVLDILRGFALFGVLLVNMLDFSGSGLRAGTLGARGNELDQLVDVSIAFFAITKFYLLFSLLFGIGFAVQMRRAEGSGRSFVGFYLRRLGVLFIIGMIHAILIWDGDILRLYAAAGLLLLLVRRLPDRVLLGAALVIAVGGLVIFGVSSNLSQMSNMISTQEITLYTNGAYHDLVMYRATQHFALDIQIPMVLVMFLVGLVIGRSGVLETPEVYKPFLRRWWKPALLIGVIGNALMLIGFSDDGSASAWLISFGVHVGAPALSFTYACAVLLNADKFRWLAPVGQMALSNYLTHSLVCTTLFYGYGFGWYDQLNPTVTLLLVFAIYSTQVIISLWWMQHYRFGLMEWVWRSLTYWQPQPLRRV